MQFKILKCGLIAVVAFELYEVYKWIVEPLIPFISSLLNGVNMSVGHLDIEHPLGMLSVNGMTAQSLVGIVTDTTVRLAVCYIVFALTLKLYAIIKRVLAA